MAPATQVRAAAPARGGRHRVRLSDFEIEDAIFHAVVATAPLVAIALTIVVLR